MSKKRRRTKGTGSVYTRKDGRVVGEYEVNGRTRYIYGRDEGEVAERVAEAIKNRDSGINSENMTVGGYLDRWLTAIRDTVRNVEAIRDDRPYPHQTNTRRGQTRQNQRTTNPVLLSGETGRGTVGICNFHKNSWRPLLERAGRPHARVHDLRHTAATLMLSRGVQIKVVSEILSHADVSTTLSIYAHVLPDMQGGAASAMDNLLG